jgi:hypothetical protein
MGTSRHTASINQNKSYQVAPGCSSVATTPEWFYGGPWMQRRCYYPFDGKAWGKVMVKLFKYETEV